MGKLIEFTFREETKRLIVLIPPLSVSNNSNVSLGNAGMFLQFNERVERWISRKKFPSFVYLSDRFQI